MIVRNIQLSSIYNIQKGAVVALTIRKNKNKKKKIAPKKGDCTLALYIRASVLRPCAVRAEKFACPRAFYKPMPRGRGVDEFDAHFSNVCSCTYRHYYYYYTSEQTPFRRSLNGERCMPVGKSRNAPILSVTLICAYIPWHSLSWIWFFDDLSRQTHTYI